MLEVVPSRTTAASADAWQRLAAAVTARRHALALSAAEIHERGGPSPAVLSKIENARAERYATSRLAALGTVLGWVPGSVDRVLAGGDPLIADSEADHADLAVMLAELKEGLDELRRSLDERFGSADERLGRLEEALELERAAERGAAAAHRVLSAQDRS